MGCCKHWNGPDGRYARCRRSEEPLMCIQRHEGDAAEKFIQKKCIIDVCDYRLKFKNILNKMEILI